MAVLTNAKHERFAQAIAKGLTGRDAYKAAGYAVKEDKTADVNASRLLTDAKVKARIAEILEKAAKRAETTVADIAAQLDEDRDFARTVKSASAMVAATMGKAKVLGLIVDRQAGADGGPIRIETVSARDRIASRLARLAAGNGTAGNPGGTDGA